MASQPPMPTDFNPFATRYTRPGELDFLWPAGESLDGLVACLQSHGWRGQIVGPHGSGKSTLLAALTPALEAAGRSILRINVVPGQKIDVFRAAREPWNSATQLIIDGYEQLSWWTRWRIKSRCRQSGAGLLITAHAEAGLPTLWRTQPNLELAREIVRRLLPAEDNTLTDADVAAAYERHPTDLRETLFALYDLYEARQRAARSA